MAQAFYLPQGTNQTAFNSDDKGLSVSDTINGLSQKNARMWQIIALVSLSAFFIALAVLARVASLPKTVPVIVTVNPDGKADYVGKVDRSLYGKQHVPEVAKTYQIKKLLKNMYTVVIDKTAQRGYIQEANDIVQHAASTQLDSFFRLNNPFNDFGQSVQTVDIEPPLKQTEKTYYVTFSVTRKSIRSYTSDTRYYSALVNIDFYETTAETNPLGIFITHFDIKELKHDKESL